MRGAANHADCRASAASSFGGPDRVSFTRPRFLPEDDGYQTNSSRRRSTSDRPARHIQGKLLIIPRSRRLKFGPTYVYEWQEVPAEKPVQFAIRGRKQAEPGKYHEAKSAEARR